MKKMIIAAAVTVVGFLAFCEWGYRQSTKVEDLGIDVDLTKEELEALLTWGQKLIENGVSPDDVIPLPCLECDGEGIVYDTKSNWGELTPYECNTCHGTGVN